VKHINTLCNVTRWSLVVTAEQLYCDLLAQLRLSVNKLSKRLIYNSRTTSGQNRAATHPVGGEMQLTVANKVVTCLMLG